MTCLKKWYCVTYWIQKWRNSCSFKPTRKKYPWQKSFLPFYCCKTIMPIHSLQAWLHWSPCTLFHSPLIKSWSHKYVTFGSTPEPFMINLNDIYFRARAQSLGAFTRTLDSISPISICMFTDLAEWGAPYEIWGKWYMPTLPVTTQQSYFATIHNTDIWMLAWKDAITKIKTVYL